MNRTGLLIALSVAAAVGLLFGLYPRLDLRVADIFYDPRVVGSWLGNLRPLQWARWLSSWLVALIAAPAFIALAVKLVLPRRPMLIPGRGVVLMIATLALGPGLVANNLLKDNWSRPRPIDVTEFGGTEHFVPWWDPRGDCPKNCSFVAGEPSGAFWTLAPAALAPPQWQALAYAAAVAFGAGVGLVRMAGGGHFFSDVMFAGVFTFLIIWLVHGLLYRWRATRTTDAAVERVLDSLTMPVHRALAWLTARTRALMRRRGADEMS
jgi:membrane-associated PAP2 superfamily phosphatase